MANKEKDSSPVLNETIPHQMNFPSFQGTGIEMKAPFVNEHGVVIGDSFYNSANSPLNNWSDEVDPSIMAGDQWVHPTNDIGWTSRENQEILEALRQTNESPDSKNNDDKSSRAAADTFMHPQAGIND